MNADRIRELQDGGHSVLAHKYNDLAECPVCDARAEATRKLLLDTVEAFKAGHSAQERPHAEKPEK